MEKPTTGEITPLVENSIDFHCHGVGRFDFTEIAALDLQEIESILARRKQRTVLTLYLPKPNFKGFINLIETFNTGRKMGKFKYLLGFGLEGPLLASHGGTPETGIWMPELQHWKELAACGEKGLIYVILSPDALLAHGSNFSSCATSSPSIAWITETLLEGGVLPAPGHFTKVDPEASAKLLQTMFDIVAVSKLGSTITDHLINDMPHNFKHAWRTPSEKMKRNQEIKLLNLESWNLDVLEEKVGVVPAVMIRNARKGYVKICQNFDGEHVDLVIVKKLVEIIGAENIIMMTDSIESKRLAGRQLHMVEDSTLLYQDQGIVAAGSQNVAHQIKSMFSIGLNSNQVKLISGTVPANIIQQRNRYFTEYHHAQANCI